MPNKQPKILFFDIETSYLMARIWRPGTKISVSHKQLVENFDRPRIICIGYKWAHERGAHYLHWGAAEQDEKPMLTEFSRLIEKADLLVAHNGDAFDLKHLNTALLLADLPPLPPVTTEDTLKQARRHFSFPSNSLGYLSHLLTESPKTKCEWKDWVAVVEGKDDKALTRMVKYCMQDVRALEAVWKKFFKFCGPTMHAGLAIYGDRESCPRCGSKSVHKDGTKVLKAGTYQRYQCQDCGSKYRDSRRLT